MPPHQYFIETPSQEGLPTKAKEDPSPHEIRLSPTGHQPSISWSQGLLLLLLLLIIINLAFRTGRSYTNFYP